jgi:hypothetical protein
MDRVSSSTTEKLSGPPEVLIMVPTGIVAGRLVANRENVTIPVADVAGSLANPKSIIHESRSAPDDVDALVVCKTCNMSHCSHSTTEAFASNIARTTEPTETSTKLVAELCRAAPISSMICENALSVRFMIDQPAVMLI